MEFPLTMTDYKSEQLKNFKPAMSLKVSARQIANQQISWLPKQNFSGKHAINWTRFECVIILNLTISVQFKAWGAKKGRNVN